MVVSLLNLEAYEIVRLVHDLVRIQRRDLHLENSFAIRMFWFPEGRRGELSLKRKLKREKYFVEMDAFIHYRKKKKSHEEIYAFTLNVSSSNV